ncbi:MAG: type I restriction-modification system subunit M [Clostridia bacterium]|nr:type I restriction-modification system subunit M [Clostridia bacterium]
MTEISSLESRIDEIINDLQGICSQHGLANQASEERIVTTIFLYKFLNDKFMHSIKEFARSIGVDYKTILANQNDELDAFYDTYSGNVAFGEEDTIEALMQQVADTKFYEKFDAALDRISTNPRNENFNIETADGTRKKLFEAISGEVESQSKNNFAKRIFATIAQERFDFSGAFKNNFDFYSRIFEHLIKNYNVASGTYAEYFTPQAISKIIAEILVGMSEKIQASEIYDPSAGSGSLILHLANELGSEDNISRAIVYTQDISNKSSRFLRINLLLNGLTDSLHNVIQGDTLLHPAHYVIEHEQTSGLKKFDYIVSNPPFKTDFSSTRDEIENNWGEVKDANGLKRFFAGIPSVPKKKKESMGIYLMFIQHIIFSLKENGKAAIVVPTGFLTAQNGIEYTIREYLIENRLLKGVISMPSNIFANTGTNVSVLFIEKTNETNEVMLIDASKLGSKVKEGKNQKTALSPEEGKLIISTFISKKEEKDFAIKVSFEQIENKKYSFSAGQYFEIVIEHIDITPEEFQSKLATFEQEYSALIEEGKELDKQILDQLKTLHLVN